MGILKERREKIDTLYLTYDFPNFFDVDDDYEIGVGGVGFETLSPSEYESIYDFSKSSLNYLLHRNEFIDKNYFETYTNEFSDKPYRI
jgi:hypothetical protein